MSNWTHVAGVIRIDYIKWDEDTPELNFDELIGKECLLFDYFSEIWGDVDKNPDKYLPFGSEGTLQKSIWINPNTSCVARYTISIFGDLRDHNSPQEIIDWFKKICNKLGNSVRNAVVTASNEVNGNLTWSWNDTEKC